MTAISDDVRNIIVGCDVRTFSHGPKDTLNLYPCTLEKNDVVLCGTPKLRSYQNAARLVVPFMHDHTLLWVPTSEMGLSENDFDWVARKWEMHLTLKRNWHDISEEELALFGAMRRHMSASLN
jgi:hypothetical protein